MIRSPGGRVKDACGAARGRCAPLDPPARFAEPGSYRTGSRLSHPQTTAAMTVKPENERLRSQTDAGKTDAGKAGRRAFSLTFFITQRDVVNVAHANRRPMQRD